MKAPCVVCGGRTRTVLRRLYDDRFGYPGHFDLLRCVRCGHQRLDASFSAEALSALYTAYYPRASMSPEEFRPPAERTGFAAWLDGERASAFRWVPPAVRVLDIGCGFGESLAYHRARGCEAVGVEADENVGPVAQRYGLAVRIGLFDPTDFDAARFDYVTADQVIEHVEDPTAFLTGIGRVLRPGGRAILSTPNSGGYGARLFGRRWINWHAPYHLQHFSRRSLAIAAQQAGLHVDWCGTITNAAWVQYQWLHLWSLPPMGLPSPFWDQARSQRPIPQRALTMERALRRAMVFRLVTRIADGLGLGDNLVCVLEKPAGRGQGPGSDE